ncbi:16S rRNA (cytosine(967)-C(5))-methyltransferase RsmB [Thiomicrospira microaerophila]|uniref:16S rRNA (cytosine(967)-C(5))-methyltransferase RsmB n=1 Tax=Thiomicrospira microaerophila TaxID=406020 RepID=UPI0020102CD1|nr:16S rRNA (cytosine(967)-C(5))-methyltransferase RsmB [Thiomicrospira microaerophila]UQB42048.1 16S rRNA (cytosine(967)-C(5))-methyltransferase RsmB [Thiomicrospira microaerophila]
MTPNARVNPRLSALKCLLAVVKQGQSLSQALPQTFQSLTDRRDRAFVQNLVYGCLRWYDRLAAIRSLLISKPLKTKDEDINLLLLMALYQLLYLDTAEHAAVSETVNLSQKLKKPWARGLLNGVLRQFLREKEAIINQLPQTLEIQTAHPSWLVKQLQKIYPDQLEQILNQNNQPAPLCLRVNTRLQSRESLLSKLAEAGIEAHPHPLSPVGIRLSQPVDVSQLPSFEQGGFSVQDIAAQQAALILQPQKAMRILDACAAPGGKTCHLLEACDNQSQLIALEKESDRIERLHQNLARLHLSAQTQVADAAELTSWWDGQAFDQILLDAPCSATGIIRRHPDIKRHRRAEDILSLTQIQAQLLSQLWQTLKPGGQLLYATCSILAQENSQQIMAFLAKTPDAEHQPLDVNWGQGEIGRQILPGEQGMDGFYYALLRKKTCVH